MDAAAYAVRKVVRNTAIVREVDRVRQREMWQWVWMSVVLVLVLLGSLWLRYDILWQSGYGMEKLQQERAAEEEKTRFLLLELERLGSPKRIEEHAKTRLHMVAPGPDDAIVIPRAIVPERPPASVVAAR